MRKRSKTFIFGTPFVEIFTFCRAGGTAPAGALQIGTRPVQSERSRRLQNPFPRGEGGPPERKRGKSGSDEECGRKAESLYSISDLLSGCWSYECGGLQFSEIYKLPPAFLISHQSVPKSRLATARNCGVIAPGNHWIYDSLRGAPPPGEAIGVLPHQCAIITISIK